MYKAKIDLPVLLIFFTRPDTFAKVFEKVKEARPSKLYLACDGPRKGREDDIKKIDECKKIASDIDWECEVHTNYAEQNMGCGMRPQTAISWALENEDRIVILEDDCVPDISFFSYMQELLEKYKDDERIGMISGLNHTRTWDCDKYSYFFAGTGAIWGWGTWARVWKKYDYTVKSLQSPYIQRLVKNQITSKPRRKQQVTSLLKTTELINNGVNISYWDLQFSYLEIYNNYLTIVPRTNLICNIGVGLSSTHANFNSNGIWKKGMLHFIPTETIESPLKHPDFVMCDTEYDDFVANRWFYPHRIVRSYKRLCRGVKKLFKK